jgi:hypothetical protein
VYEPNETPAQSPSILSNGGPWPLTFFSDPDGNGKGQADTDVFRIAATQGVVYTVTTTNLVSDANTNLEILGHQRHHRPCVQQRLRRVHRRLLLSHRDGAADGHLLHPGEARHRRRGSTGPTACRWTNP